MLLWCASNFKPCKCTLFNAIQFVLEKAFMFVYSSASVAEYFIENSFLFSASFSHVVLPYSMFVFGIEKSLNLLNCAILTASNSGARTTECQTKRICLLHNFSRQFHLFDSSAFQFSYLNVN